MAETTQLSDKEELFCLEYLVDLNQTQAYLRSYKPDNYDSARVLASRLFSNVNIRARIKELMDIRSSTILVDAGYVVESLLDISQKCQQAKPVLEWDSETRQMKETGEFEFDSNGANKALELIGRHLGMWKDKLDIKAEVSELIIKGRKFSDQTNADNA